MPEVLELEATDVTESRWEDLVSQMASDFPVDMVLNPCSTTHQCDCNLDCTL